MFSKEPCCLHQETADSQDSFWSSGKSLDTHRGGSLRSCDMVFAQLSEQVAGCGGNCRGGDFCPRKEEGALLTSPFPSPAGTAVLWLPSQLPSSCPSHKPRGLGCKDVLSCLCNVGAGGLILSSAKCSHAGGSTPLPEMEWLQPGLVSFGAGGENWHRIKQGIAAFGHWAVTGQHGFGCWERSALPLGEATLFFPA